MEERLCITAINESFSELRDTGYAQLSALTVTVATVHHVGRRAVLWAGAKGVQTVKKETEHITVANIGNCNHVWVFIRDIFYNQPGNISGCNMTVTHECCVWMFTDVPHLSRELSRVCRGGERDSLLSESQQSYPLSLTPRFCGLSPPSSHSCTQTHTQLLKRRKWSAWCRSSL